MSSVRRCLELEHTTASTTRNKWWRWSTRTCVWTVASATWSAMTPATRPSPSTPRHTSPAWRRTAQAALCAWVCAPSSTASRWSHAPRASTSRAGESPWEIPTPSPCESVSNRLAYCQMLMCTFLIMTIMLKCVLYCVCIMFCIILYLYEINYAGDESSCKWSPLTSASWKAVAFIEYTLLCGVLELILVRVDVEEARV